MIAFSLTLPATRLARELGGWQVIAWALLLAAPMVILPVAMAMHQLAGTAGPAAWLAFAYVAVAGMFLGMLAWFRGLALGGVARVGQVQLLQPVLTLFWASLLLGESIGPRTALASPLVVGSDWLARWSWPPTASTERPE